MQPRAARCHGDDQAICRLDGRDLVRLGDRDRPVDRRYAGCDVDPPGDQGSFDVLHDGSQLDADRAVRRGRDQGVRIVVQRRQQLGVADLQRALPRLSKGVGGDEGVDPVSDQVLMPCVAGAFNASSAALARGLTPSALIPSMTSDVSCSTSRLALIEVDAWSTM